MCGRVVRVSLGACYSVHQVGESTFEVSMSASGESSDGSTRLRMSRAFGDFYFKQNKTLPAEAQAVCALPDVRIVPR